MGEREQSEPVVLNAHKAHWCGCRQAVCPVHGRRLALREALGACVSDITLKWPNDVYWRDYKISGTLIETALSGKKVKQCIFGTGINVNQTLFLSSAPNPTSLCLITGRTFSKDEVLDKVLKAFERYYQMVLDGRYDTISEPVALPAMFLRPKVVPSC